MRRSLAFRRRAAGLTPPRSGSVIVSAGSHHQKTATLAAVYGYDAFARRWSRLPDLPTARHGLGVVALGGRVYAVGGGPTPGLSVSGANEFLQLR